MCTYDLRNKIKRVFCLVFVFLCSFMVIKTNAHGFAQGTLIKTLQGRWWSIEQVCRLSHKNNKQIVASYDSRLGCLIKQQVRAGAESETNCYCRIGFDDRRCCDIVCTPVQEFYIPLFKEWRPAYVLKVGDTLLDSQGVLIKITYVEFVKQPIKVYSIEVKNTHNFFVGHYAVLTHNMFLPVALSLGLGGSFGSGAAIGGATGGFFGPITFAGGMIIGGLIGIAIKVFSDDKPLSQYRLAFDVDVIDEYLKNDNEQRGKNNDAQAPGKPTENDGFFPPKRWDGKKVKNPNGTGYGWPDKNGKVWIPTGPNGHGAPHWDVEDSDGSYKNVMPGGRLRGQK